MLDSPLVAAAKFRKAAERVARSSNRGEVKAALFVKKTILSISPARLRNVGKKGSKLGVGYRPNPGGGIFIGARGPWQIIERDTRAHLIGGGKSKLTEKRAYLQFATGDIRLGPIHHPGTQGKHLFRKGVEIARPVVPLIIDAEVKVALISVFGF